MKILKEYFKQMFIMIMAFLTIFTAYWALTSVNNWDILSASQWNEIVWKLNSVDSTWTGLVSKNYVDSAVGAWGGSMKVYKNDGITVLGTYLWYTTPSWYAFTYQTSTWAIWILQSAIWDFNVDAFPTNTIYYSDSSCSNIIWINITVYRVKIWSDLYQDPSFTWNPKTCNNATNIYKKINGWACANHWAVSVTPCSPLSFLQTSACWTWPCIIK
jgi:hypothetical protein